MSDSPEVNQFWTEVFKPVGTLDELDILGGVAK
jgi:hypothetical protein